VKDELPEIHFPSGKMLSPENGHKHHRRFHPPRKLCENFGTLKLWNLNGFLAFHRVRLFKILLSSEILKSFQKIRSSGKADETTLCDVSVVIRCRRRRRNAFTIHFHHQYFFSRIIDIYLQDGVS